MGNIEHWSEDDAEVHRAACALSHYYDGDGGDAEDWIGGATVALNATNLRGAVEAADDIRWAADFIQRELNAEVAWARADRLRAAADALDGGQ